MRSVQFAFQLLALQDVRVHRSTDTFRYSEVLYVPEYMFSWRFNPLWLYFPQPGSAGFSLLVFRGFLISHNDAPRSVGLLWPSDQSVAETST